MSRIILTSALAVALSVFGLASCVDEPEPDFEFRDNVGLGMTSSAADAVDDVGNNVPAT